MLRRTSGLVLRCSAGLPPALWRAFSGEPGRSGGEQWHWMVSQGHHINPCNSLLHPAVKEAGIMPDEGATELPVQAAYTPQSTCFGCGEFLWCFPRNNGRPIRAPVPQTSESQLLVVPVSRIWACYLLRTSATSTTTAAAAAAAHPLQARHTQTVCICRVDALRMVWKHASLCPVNTAPFRAF